MKQLHDYAKFFPPMEGEEFKALCQDVKAHGLINPIVLYEDKILDGRNRARACDEVGVRPKYEEKAFKNGGALDYVISQNVLRRHLTSSQRSILALELEEKFAKEPKAKGGNHVGRATSGSSSGDSGISARNKRKDEQSSAGRAAKALQIGSGIVKLAKRLKKDAPHLVSKVRKGEISVKEALLEARDERVAKMIARDKERAKEKRRQVNRRVAQYQDAMSAYITALKVAKGDVEVFAPEAIQFTKGRHTEIRRLMSELENALKAA